MGFKKILYLCARKIVNCAIDNAIRTVLVTPWRGVGTIEWIEEHTGHFFNKRKLKQMKKTYIQPAIELVAVEVEQGIAASVDSSFTLEGYDTDNEVTFEW